MVGLTIQIPTAVSAEPVGSLISMPDGSISTIASGNTAKLEIINDGNHAISQNGESKSIGASTSGDKIDESLKFDSSKIGFDNMFANTGKSSFSAKITSNAGMLGGFIFGAVLVVCGIVCLIWLHLPQLGLALIIAGIAVIALAVVVASFAWLFVLMVILGVGFAIYMVWKANKAKVADTTATTVITGIENGSKIGPADLPIPIDAADYAKVQVYIDATVKAIKAQVAKLDSKNGGKVSSFLEKIGI